jgi:Cys-tRNA(Pro) deacylase
MSENTPPVSLALEKLNIPHRVFTHPGPVNSLEQAARERGQRPEQVVRSILFRTGEDEYLMALVAGPAQISWKALRAYLGQSRLTMASEEEVLAVTGYPIGAVSPFGTVRTLSGTGSLRVLVDPGIFVEEEISIGSGIRGTTVILKTDDLRRALGDFETVELFEATA